MEADFKGYASRYNVKCSDGRTIAHGAFADYDGATVPMVWEHDHNDPQNVIGKAVLEHRDDGLFAYGYFNNTERGIAAKELVQHGDINRLSIFANHIKERNGIVSHGNPIEVSLVFAGANEGAFIDTVSFAHGETDVPYEGIIFSGDDIVVSHSELEGESSEGEDISHADKPSRKTVKEIFDTLNDEQKNLFMYLLTEAIDEATKNVEDDEDNKTDNKNVLHSDDGGDSMKHNVFADSRNSGSSKTLSHSQLELMKDEKEIFKEAQATGSLKAAVLAHSATYGIDNVDYLFPEAKLVDGVKNIDRDQTWVGILLSGLKFVPFRRIKSVFADITADEARARGYVKGNKKLDEVITLLKRETTPTTIYKKQTMDRDDLLDLEEFNAVAMLKKEMTGKIDEEFARAILVGDGRNSSDQSKINPINIRPIATDDNLYAVKVPVAVDSDMSVEDRTNAVMDEIIRSRKKYKGAGNPIAFITEDLLSDMILLKDKMGHRLYKTMEELCSALRVRSIVSCPVMEGVSRTAESKKYDLACIIVNPVDYAVGRDPRVPEEGFFDDFDLNYNKEIYLTERRRSGALVTPYSALVVEFVSTVSG